MGRMTPPVFPEREAWSPREEGARLVAQVEALWDGNAGAGTGDRDLALRQLRARSCAVRQLHAAADVSRAIATGIRTLADSERVLGADHPQTLTSRNNLAYAYQAAGGWRRRSRCTSGPWPTASGCCLSQRPKVGSLARRQPQRRQPDPSALSWQPGTLPVPRG